MKTNNRELRDWFIITVIILIGFLCLIVAGSMAVRFSPSWELDASMDSHLDPNSDFLTRRPLGFIEPVDESILTPPIWMGLFQTPGAFIPQRTSLPPITSVPAYTSTSAPVSTSPATPTLIPTNTVIYNIPASPTNTPRPQPQATATVPAPTVPPTVPVTVDLQITKDDGVFTYTAGGSSTYVISVTNNSTFDLAGITVRDTIPSLVTTWGWCVAPCAPLANTNTNLGATINLTAGSSITYNLLANIHPFAMGNLNNTASVDAPLGYTDAVPGNNTATDVNINQTGEPEEGPPDGNVYTVPNGGQAVFYLSRPIAANGDMNADFVFYEYRTDIGGGVQGILLDQIIIEISQDGLNWFRVFYWGGGGSDTNTNVATVAACPTEMDNCPIPLTDLYNGNSAGITVDVDNSPLDTVPTGNYPWIRFTEPSGVGDGAQVDSVEILP